MQMLVHTIQSLLHSMSMLFSRITDINPLYKTYFVTCSLTLNVPHPASCTLYCTILYCTVLIRMCICKHDWTLIQTMFTRAQLYCTASQLVSIHLCDTANACMPSTIGLVASWILCGSNGPKAIERRKVTAAARIGQLGDNLFPLLRLGRSWKYPLAFRASGH